MASIPITIQGVMFYSGLDIGGGPMPGGPGGPSVPQPPLGIWGGPFDPPRIWPGPGPLPGIEHPIVLPPDLPPTLPPPDNRPVEWKAVWIPGPGWAVIGIPQGPVPTPSAPT